MTLKHNNQPPSSETQKLPPIDIGAALAARIDEINRTKTTYGRNRSEQTEWIVGFFHDQNADSFSKMIPRRPTKEGGKGFSGPYDELAQQSLTSALKHKSADGSVPLLGKDVIEQRLVDLIQGTPKQVGLKPEKAVETEKASMYTEGIPTALWKLGFMTVENEAGIPYGRMKINQNVTTSKEQRGPLEIHHMQLPFDKTNALHAMLAHEIGVPAPAFVEVQTSISPHPSYARSAYTPPSMTLRLIEQPVGEARAAA